MNGGEGVNSMYYIGSMAYDPNYLEHHGILGMKWGVRRYQNPDGSLTAAGEARYYKLKRNMEQTRSIADARSIDAQKAYNKASKAQNAKILKPSQEVKDLLVKRSEYKNRKANDANIAAYKAEKKFKKFDDLTNMYRDYAGIKEYIRNEHKEQSKSLTKEVDKSKSYEAAVEFSKKWMNSPVRTDVYSRSVKKLIDRLNDEVTSEEFRDVMRGRK